jgi:SAM-dependent methyltransferase
MASETRRDNLAIVRANVQMFGLWRTLGDLIGYLFTAPPRDRFDARYGVATAGNVATTAAGITDATALADAIRYVPISEQVMRHVLDGVSRVADPASLSFVDLGCGKGRALVMASWYPFRQIAGVELSPQHAELAERNARGYLARPRRGQVRCDRIAVACANALHCDLPGGDLLVFMYRPFKGQVFQGVIDRLHQLRATTGRRVLIAYVCPVERAMLERHPGFQLVQDVQVIVDEHRWTLWEARAAPALAAPAS